MCDMTQYKIVPCRVTWAVSKWVSHKPRLFWRPPSPVCVWGGLSCVCLCNKMDFADFAQAVSVLASPDSGVCVV